MGDYICPRCMTLSVDSHMDICKVCKLDIALQNVKKDFNCEPEMVSYLEDVIKRIKEVAEKYNYRRF